MTEQTVAMLYCVRNPRTNHHYGWLALTEDAVGIPLPGGSETDLLNAARAHLIALFGGEPFHIELVNLDRRSRESCAKPDP